LLIIIIIILIIIIITITIIVMNTLNALVVPCPSQMPLERRDVPVILLVLLILQPGSIVAWVRPPSTRHSGSSSLCGEHSSKPKVSGGGIVGVL